MITFEQQQYNDALEYIKSKLNLDELESLDIDDQIFRALKILDKIQDDNFISLFEELTERYEDEVSELKDEIDELTDVISTLEDVISTLNDEIDTLHENMF